MNTREALPGGCALDCTLGRKTASAWADAVKVSQHFLVAESTRKCWESVSKTYESRTEVPSKPGFGLQG